MNNILLPVSIVAAIFIIVIIALLLWHKKKTKVLKEELNLFKMEKEFVSEAMMVLSETYDVVFANQSAKALFSLDDKYHVLPDATEVKLKIDTSEPANFFEVIQKEFEKQEDSFHLQNVLLVILGKMKQVNIYVDKSGWNLNKTISCVIDMNTVKPEEAKNVQKEGGIDFFTGLPSQFMALTEINGLVMQTQKASESFTLFLLGIDHFNDLQATLGLTASNNIIKNIAEYLDDNSSGMKVYRMDCEKFLLVLKQTQTNQEAHAAAKKIIVDMKKNEEESFHLTTSIGIAKYPENGENAAKLINHVYMALQQAQKESDSNIAFFTNEYQTIQKDEAQLHQEIEEGLKKHEFFLYYQPLFNIKTEELAGAEALLRWRHPEQGIIAADQFLEVAKKTGLIVDIGEYVFREAIKQRKVWNDEGLKKFKITLNLSLKEMQEDKLIEKLETLFEDNEISPKNFNLDISENSAMSNVEKTAIVLKRYKDIGLSISIDHFGSGASSLKHLQMLPLSTVKLDRSLIFDMYSNLDHQITVKSMIALIHGLGFKAVAEGVETSKESALLYDFGCDYAQGYLYAKPLPAKELAELLR